MYYLYIFWILLTIKIKIIPIDKKGLIKKQIYVIIKHIKLIGKNYEFNVIYKR